MGRRSRRRAADGAPRSEGAREPASRGGSATSRTEAKNAAAREKLAPLAEGERPRAVTIGAIVAAAIAVANLGAWVAGVEVRGEQPSIAWVVVLGTLLLVTAWGMWRARYWAVLAMQALLGLTLVTVSLSVLFQVAGGELLPALLSTVLVLVPAGALFWFLIRAMARIQMPSRR